MHQALTYIFNICQLHSGFFQTFNDNVRPKNGFFRPKMFFLTLKKEIRIFSHDPLASLYTSSKDYDAIVFINMVSSLLTYTV